MPLTRIAGTPSGQEAPFEAGLIQDHAGQPHIREGRQHAATADVEWIGVARLHAEPELEAGAVEAAVQRPVVGEEGTADRGGLESFGNG